MFRQLFLTLSHSRRLRRVATDVAIAQRVALRFVAGETLEDALRVIRSLNAKGMHVTLDHLGENVTSVEMARQSAVDYVTALRTIAAEQVQANVSLKLTQMGLDVDADLCRENLERILAVAAETGNFVRIDMEGSPYTQRTLDLYDALRDAGFDNTGVVIQAYLYRSEGDIERLIERGAAVRLCKGAYDEKPVVAYPRKRDVDANYIRLMKMLLGPRARERGVRAAIATHDENMIRATQTYLSEQGLPQGTVEFQMLYGVRPARQEHLAAAGYPFRVYVPYGTEWYPYFMRRLGERPANVIFLAKNFFRS
ncbi:MAG: proline dehydrogenase [Chloroflexi bacterium]|nr:proline dehydrogenase [Chloroflexota bacterium]